MDRRGLLQECVIKSFIIKGVEGRGRSGTEGFRPWKQSFTLTGHFIRYKKGADNIRLFFFLLLFIQGNVCCLIVLFNLN